jgi:hypothetical protein
LSFKLTNSMEFGIRNNRFYGDVAQLGERGVRNAEVEGSIPFISISIKTRT